MKPGWAGLLFYSLGTGAIGAGCNGGGWNRAYATKGRTGSRRLSSGCRGNHGPRRSEPVKLPARCVPKSTLRETNMADLVRGDGGGFLAGSFAAVLAVLGIYFLTLAF